MKRNIEDKEQVQKNMDRKTQFIFRLKCIIKKCREKGLFSIAIKLKEKYERRNDARNN